MEISNCQLEESKSDFELSKNEFNGSFPRHILN